MANVLEALLKGLTPDAQIILAMCVFMLILLIATSRSATRNFCAMLGAIARLITGIREPKPPKQLPERASEELPNQDAA